MAKTKKVDTIIYIAPSRSSFVQNDITMLSANYNVIVNFHNWNKKALLPIFLIKQFLFLVLNSYSAKYIIVSFGGYWSLLPTLFAKLFNKPVAIILNGTDCASIPRINYGSLRKPLLKQIIKWSYQLATVLLPVSKSLVSVKNTFYSDDEMSYQGYKELLPEVTTPFKVIHNGFNTDFWKKDPSIVKEPNTFLSVFSESQFYLKGGDLIYAAANYFTNCQFTIVGLEKPSHLKAIKNLTFHGKVDAQILKQYYSRSQYYLQLSIFEGFGCSLAEAMLCECIPIGSSVNIIPDIIGDSGFIVYKRDEKELINLISSLLNNYDKIKADSSARDQIVSHFDIDKRKNQLLTLIESQVH